MISQVNFVVAFVVCLGPSKHLLYIISLDQGFSAFLTLQPLTSSSCCGDPPPTTELFLLLLFNCNFVTVVNRNVNMFSYGLPRPCGDSQVERELSLQTLAVSQALHSEQKKHIPVFLVPPLL